VKSKVTEISQEKSRAQVQDCSELLENNVNSDTISKKVISVCSEKNNQIQGNEDISEESSQMTPALTEEKVDEKRSTEPTVDISAEDDNTMLVSAGGGDSLLEVDPKDYRDVVHRGTEVPVTADAIPSLKKPETILDLTSSSQETPDNIINVNNANLLTNVQELKNSQQRMSDVMNKDVTPKNTPLQGSVFQGDAMTHKLENTEPLFSQEQSVEMEPLLPSDCKSEHVETQKVFNQNRSKEKLNQGSMTDERKIPDRKASGDFNQIITTLSFNAGSKSEVSLFPIDKVSSPQGQDSSFSAEDLNLESKEALLLAKLPGATPADVLDHIDSKDEDKESKDTCIIKPVFLQNTKQKTDINKTETLQTLHTKEEAIMDEVHLMVHAQVQILLFLTQLPYNNITQTACAHIYSACKGCVHSY